MHASRYVIVAVLAAGLFATGTASAQSAADARQVVTRAAEALGGVDRIQALRTIRLRGYGHDAAPMAPALVTEHAVAHGPDHRAALDLRREIRQIRIRAVPHDR